jgi:hypothetical protein
VTETEKVAELDGVEFPPEEEGEGEEEGEEEGGLVVVTVPSGVVVVVTPSGA